MATEKVHVQMRMGKARKTGMGYVAWGKAAQEICETICVRDAAFAKLGKPYAIKVTIEEAGLPVEIR